MSQADKITIGAIVGLFYVVTIGGPIVLTLFRKRWEHEWNADGPHILPYNGLITLLIIAGLISIVPMIELCKTIF